MKALDKIKALKLDILLLICICLFVVGIVDKSFQNDMFSAIRIGNYIIENGVDDVEPLTFHEGLKFVKVRWAFDVAVAAIYNTWNFQGVYCFTVIITMLIAISLYLCLSKLYGSKTISFLIVIMTMFLIREWITCRAQIVSYLIFALELFFIQKLLSTNSNRYTIVLVVLSLVLVNFHASVWIVYFLPFLAYFVGRLVNTSAFFNNCLSSFGMLKEDYTIKKLLITFVLCVITGFLTPLKLAPFTFMFKVMGGISKSFIIELQPFAIDRIYPIIIIVTIIVIVALLEKIKVKITDVFLIIGFTIFAVIALRNYYISMIFLAYPITFICISYCKQKTNDDIIGTLDKLVTESNPFLIILLIFFVSISYINYSKISKQEYVSDDFPVMAVEFIKENLDIDSMRIYTDFNYGSYVEYEGIKVFLDSRSEVYTKEFSDVSILEDWKGLRYDNTVSADELNEKYNFTHWLVLDNDAADISLQESNLKYDLIYSDEYFKLYEVR